MIQDMGITYVNQKGITFQHTVHIGFGCTCKQIVVAESVGYFKRSLFELVLSLENCIYVVEINELVCYVAAGE